eukprot:UC4_evm1s1153
MTEKGQKYFVNHNKRNTTKFDPRRKYSSQEKKDYISNDKNRQEEQAKQIRITNEMRLKERVAEKMNRAALLIQKMFRGSRIRAKLIEKREDSRFYKLHGGERTVPRSSRPVLYLGGVEMRRRNNEPIAFGAVGKNVNCPANFLSKTKKKHVIIKTRKPPPNGPVGSPKGLKAQMKEEEYALIQQKNKKELLAAKNARFASLPKKKLYGRFGHQNQDESRNKLCDQSQNLETDKEAYIDLPSNVPERNCNKLKNKLPDNLFVRLEEEKRTREAQEKIALLEKERKKYEQKKIDEIQNKKMKLFSKIKVVSKSFLSAEPNLSLSFEVENVHHSLEEEQEVFEEERIEHTNSMDEDRTEGCSIFQSELENKNAHLKTRKLVIWDGKSNTIENPPTSRFREELTWW